MANWQVKIPKSKTLPEVLTIDQVHQIIDAVKVQQIAVYLWTVYSMGFTAGRRTQPASR